MSYWIFSPLIAIIQLWIVISYWITMISMDGCLVMLLGQLPSATNPSLTQHFGKQPYHNQDYLRNLPALTPSTVASLLNISTALMTPTSPRSLHHPSCLSLPFFEALIVHVLIRPGAMKSLVDTGGHGSFPDKQREEWVNWPVIHSA